MTKGEPIRNNLCGSGPAHRACKFAGTRQEKPPRLPCAAEQHDYARCPYKDSSGRWHLLWRSRIERGEV